MEYTPIEQQTLVMMRRTDFKNLSKSDVLSIASKLGELRPDVAKEVLISNCQGNSKICKAIRGKSKENEMYSQATATPNTLLRKGAYGIVMRECKNAPMRAHR